MPRQSPLALTLCLFALLLSSPALAQTPTAPASQPAVFSIAEHRPYPKAIKLGGTLIYDPALKPKGIAGVGLTGDQVNKAINRGRDYLWPLLKKRSSSPKWTPSRNDLLVSLALLHADAQATYPEFAALTRQIVDRINPDALGNYEVPLILMMAERTTDDFKGPAGAALLDSLVRPAAQRVIESQGVQGAFGYNWGPGAAPRWLDRPAAPASPDARDPLKRTTKATTSGDGDNSTTQYAAMSLWRATRAGYAIDPDIWKRCREAVATRESPDGGWAYVKPGKSTPSYGSMTAACITTISLCLIHENAEPLDDPAVQRGLAWLSINWTVRENPKNKRYLYYYLYGLERLGGLLGTEFIGSHEWYPQGARFLVDAQRPDGSWNKEDDEQDTAFAILFLTRATGTRQGPGELKTTPPDFVVLDKLGKPVARGRMGDSRPLPPGDYTLRTTIGETTFEKPFSIPNSTTLTITPADLTPTPRP